MLSIAIKNFILVFVILLIIHVLIKSYMYDLNLQGYSETQTKQKESFEQPKPVLKKNSSSWKPENNKEKRVHFESFEPEVKVKQEDDVKIDNDLYDFVFNSEPVVKKETKSEPIEFNGNHPSEFSMFTDITGYEESDSFSHL